MNLKLIPRRKPRRLERLDVVMDSYVTWREASRAVSSSYRGWSLAGQDERETAFARYTRALDQEEEAAARHRGALESLCPAERGHGGRPASDVASLQLP